MWRSPARREATPASARNFCKRTIYVQRSCRDRRNNEEIFAKPGTDGEDPLRNLKISIIIPAFNEERLIGATLQHVGKAMQAFTRRGWPAELIVCDNNST